MNIPLEDQVTQYTSAQFDPSIAAQKIFSTATNESEIAKKRSDLSKTQQSIESILKNIVKANYESFLEANRDISMVGQDMGELKQLISNTRVLISDAKGTRISDARAMRANSLLPSLAEYRKEAEERQLENAKLSSNPENGIPSWLASAVDEIQQYIIEHQYQKAVATVVKARSYIEGLEKLKQAKSTNDKVMNRSIQEVLKKINECATLLADKIKSTLLDIPTSPLWGAIEQVKRLKMLITLKEYREAGDGFSLIKQQQMQRSLLSVESSSNIILYAKCLTASFLSELTSSVHIYCQLFDDFINSSDIILSLVQWTRAQTADFIGILMQQVQIVVTETAVLSLIQLRNQRSFNNNNNTNNDGNAGDTLGRLSPTRRASLLKLNPSRRDSSTSNSGRLSPSNIPSQQGTSNAGNASISMGGLTILSQVLADVLSITSEFEQQVTQKSSKNTTKSLPIYSFCIFYMLPFIRRLVAYYIEEFISEVSPQVTQDAWISSTWSGERLWKATSIELEEMNGLQLTVSSSYVWVASCVAHIFDEITTLLMTKVDKSTSERNEKERISLRSDLCEIEPISVSFLLRIILRYVMELENLNVGNLTRSQLICFRSTLRAIQKHLLPMTQKSIERALLAERMNLLSSSCTPSSVIKTLYSRIMKLAMALDNNGLDLNADASQEHNSLTEEPAKFSSNDSDYRKRGSHINPQTSTSIERVSIPSADIGSVSASTSTSTAAASSSSGPPSSGARYVYRKSVIMENKN